MDYGFDNYNYNEILSDIVWAANDPVTLAQVDNIENYINLNDPEEMFEFAIHDMDLSSINSDYLQKFKHEINVNW